MFPYPDFGTPSPVTWELVSSCVEAGSVWSAKWAARRIVLYRSDGQLDRIIETPALQSTRPCLCGENFDVWYQAQASTICGIEAQQLGEADSEVLTWYDLDVKGLPEGWVAEL